MLYINPQVQSGYKDLSLSPGADRREAEALKEFERLFLFQMLKAMRKTVPDGGLFGGGMKREYFEEMLDDEAAPRTTTLPTGFVRVATGPLPEYGNAQAYWD